MTFADFVFKDRPMLSRNNGVFPPTGQIRQTVQFRELVLADRLIIKVLADKNGQAGPEGHEGVGRR